MHPSSRFQWFNQEKRTHRQHLNDRVWVRALLRWPNRSRYRRLKWARWKKKGMGWNILGTDMGKMNSVRMVFETGRCHWPYIDQDEQNKRVADEENGTQNSGSSTVATRTLICCRFPFSILVIPIADAPSNMHISKALKGKEKIQWIVHGRVKKRLTKMGMKMMNADSLYCRTYLYVICRFMMICTKTSHSSGYIRTTSSLLCFRASLQKHLSRVHQLNKICHGSRNFRLHCIVYGRVHSRCACEQYQEDVIMFRCRVAMW